MPEVTVTSKAADYCIDGLGSWYWPGNIAKAASTGQLGPKSRL